MPDESPIRVLIVDDEAPARRRLDNLLGDREGISVTDRASEGAEAVEKIRAQDPDLVFLDVQMPDLSGLDVVREIGPEEMPSVIFVTAYDEYAIEAFELAALDYLLKPFDNERFNTAVDRAQRAIRQREVDELRRRLGRLLDGRSSEEAGGPGDDHLERIAVQKRGQIRVVPVEEINYIEASGAYAELHVGEETHLIRERMKTLERQLDPRQFIRVHRSFIVKIDRIESLLVNEGGNYSLRLTDGSRVKVSRSRRENLEERLGLEL